MSSHFDPNPHAAFRRTVRAQALAVAGQQLAEGGWDRVNMAGIAKAVGVSRPTLYAEFGRKEGLAEALVMAEADQFLAGIDTILQDSGDEPLLAIETVVAYVLTEAQRSPILRAVFTTGRTEEPESDSLLALLSVRAENILTKLTDGTVQWLIAQCPDTPAVQVSEAVDALVRLLISYLMSPAAHPEQTPGMFAWLAVRLLPELAT